MGKRKLTFSAISLRCKFFSNSTGRKKEAKIECRSIGSANQRRPGRGEKKKSFLPLLSILVKVEGTKFDQGRRASLPSCEKPQEAPRIGPFVIPPPPTSVVGGKVLFFSSPPGLPHNTQRHRRGGGGLKNSKSYFDRGGGGTTVRRWKNFRRLLQEFWSFVKLHLGASCNK